MTAPEPVTNQVFTQVLAEALHRPAILPAPAFAMKMLLGEMSELLLKGQKVLPDTLQKNGFSYGYAQVGAAMKAIFAGPETKS